MPEVSYSVEDRVAVLRLEAAGRGNAFSPDMRRELSQAFNTFKEDAAAWVGLVCGDGPDFCAGSIPEPNPSHHSGRERDLLWAGGRVETMKPIIAAVQGVCSGEGLALALGCDLRVAQAGRVGGSQAGWVGGSSESASFRAGMEQDGGGPGITAVWLVNLLGLSAALDILWSRESLDAQAAHRMGLVNRIVQQGEAPDSPLSQTLDAEARLPIRPLAPAIVTPEGTAFSGGMALARELLQYAPVTRSFQKETAYRSIGVPFHYAQTLEVGPNPYASEDRIEGTRAFVENRRPVWHNR